MDARVSRELIEHAAMILDGVYTDDPDRSIADACRAVARDLRNALSTPADSVMPKRIDDAIGALVEAAQRAVPGYGDYGDYRGYDEVLARGYEEEIESLRVAITTTLAPIVEARRAVASAESIYGRTGAIVDKDRVMLAIRKLLSTIDSLAGVGT